MSYFSLHLLSIKNSKIESRSTKCSLKFFWRFQGDSGRFLELLWIILECLETPEMSTILFLAAFLFLQSSTIAKIVTNYKSF